MFILFLIVDKSLKLDRALSPTEGGTPAECVNPGCAQDILNQLPAHQRNSQ